MNWDDLRCIEALARLRSVAAAARELHVSSSTLYRRIAVFEASTGIRCLVRGASGTELTEAGRALAAAGQRTRESIVRVMGEVKSRDEGMTGEVSVTTVEGMLPFLGAPLAALTERHPSLTVQLHLGDSGPSVRRREVDVAIGIMRRPPAGCWGRRLFRIRYGVFGTEAAIHREPLRWVVLGAGLAQSPEGQWEATHASQVAVAASSRTGTVELARAGAGVALLPRALAVRHPELVELRPSQGGAVSWRQGELDALERVAWVLTHESNRQTPRIKALMTALFEGLSGGLE